MAGDGSIRVLLIERHALVREGLRLLLAGELGLAVVGAADVAGGLALLGALGGARGVDAVVLDPSQGGGAALVARARALAPGAAVVALSLRRAGAEAADAHVDKRAAAHELATAIRAAAR